MWSRVFGPRWAEKIFLFLPRTAASELGLYHAFGWRDLCRQASGSWMLFANGDDMRLAIGAHLPHLMDNLDDTFEAMVATGWWDDVIEEI